MPRRSDANGENAIKFRIAGFSFALFFAAGASQVVAADQFFGPRDVVWTGQYFVAAVASVAMVSSDGILWNTVQYDVHWSSIRKLAWDGERILGVGFGVYSAKSDGGQWVRMPDPPQHYLESIASDGEQFVAVHSNGVVRTGDDLFADGLE